MKLYLLVLLTCVFGCASKNSEKYIPTRGDSANFYSLGFYSNPIDSIDYNSANLDGYITTPGTFHLKMDTASSKKVSTKWEITKSGSIIHHIKKNTDLPKKSPIELEIIDSGYISGGDNMWDSAVYFTVDTMEAISDTSKLSDTTRIMILYSDTASIEVRGLPYLEYAHIKDTFLWKYPSLYFIKDNDVHWQLGYEVRVFSGSRLYDNVMYLDADEIYLDENKKPLPKSIVVWQIVSLK